MGSAASDEEETPGHEASGPAASAPGVSSSEAATSSGQTSGGGAGLLGAWSRVDPVSRLGAAVGGLFLLACLYTVHIARSFLLPFVLAILFSLLLEPLVRRGARLLPRALAAALVLLLVLAGLALAGWRIQGPAAEMIDDMPRRMRAVERQLRGVKNPLQPVTEATEKVEEMANQLGEGSQRRPQEVVTVQAEPTLSESVVRGMRSLLFGAAVLIALLFFLLASENRLLAKLLRLAPQLEDRDEATLVASRIERDLARYLLTITAINLGLGVAVGVAMALLGVPSPVLWGVLAAIANYIPYLGALTVIGLLVLSNAAAGGDLWTTMVAPAAIYAGLTAFEGTFLTPLALGSRLKLNPVAIFVGLLFWGWLWGIVGVLLAVPLLVATKIICDHVAPQGPVADLLS